MIIPQNVQLVLKHLYVNTIPLQLKDDPNIVIAKFDVSTNDPPPDFFVRG